MCFSCLQCEHQGAEESTEKLAPPHCCPRDSKTRIVSIRASNMEGAMSALGQKQTHAVQQRMSALPPIATAKADITKKVMSTLPLKADMCSARAKSAMGQQRTFPDTWSDA